MKLHMGFNETPYEYQPRTAAEVAQFLESRYGIVDVFYTMHEEEILAILAEAQTEALAAIAQGKKRTVILRRPDAVKIENLFKRAISNAEFDGHIAGVPTKEATKGSRRGRRRRVGGRASFLNTGTYRNAFRIWAE